MIDLADYRSPPLLHGPHSRVQSIADIIEAIGRSRS
jgi:hypothetical protein